MGLGKLPPGNQLLITGGEKSSLHFGIIRDLLSSLCHWLIKPVFSVHIITFPPPPRPADLKPTDSCKGHSPSLTHIYNVLRCVCLNTGLERTNSALAQKPTVVEHTEAKRKKVKKENQRNDYVIPVLCPQADSQIVYITSSFVYGKEWPKKRKQVYVVTSKWRPHGPEAVQSKRRGGASQEYN